MLASSASLTAARVRAIRELRSYEDVPARPRRIATRLVIWRRRRRIRWSYLTGSDILSGHDLDAQIDLVKPTPRDLHLVEVADRPRLVWCRRRSGR